MSQEVDPFGLPDWLGTADVTWAAETGLRTGYLVRGRLSGDHQVDVVPCDLLAVDEAYPAPVLTDHIRTRVHQTWRHGQVALLCLDDRLTLAVPGYTFDAERVLETLARLAKAVGAAPQRYVAAIRLGED